MQEDIGQAHPLCNFYRDQLCHCIRANLRTPVKRQVSDWVFSSLRVALRLELVLTVDNVRDATLDQLLDDRRLSKQILTVCQKL